MSLFRTVLVAVALVGCSRSDTAPAPDGTAPTPAAQTPAVARAQVEVASGPGESWATLEPKGEGYRLRGGSLDGAKIKVAADRVKLKGPSDATKAKVKTKDYGFKIYSDDETAVAKVKRKGAGFKVSSPEGAAWGEVSAKGGTLSSQAVVIEDSGDRLVVKRGGQVVGEVGSSIGAKAACMLAITEIAMEQRVAAMIFVQEKMP